MRSRTRFAVASFVVTAATQLFADTPANTAPANTRPVPPATPDASSVPVTAVPVNNESIVVLDPVEVSGTTPSYLSLTDADTVTSYSGAFLKATGIVTYSEIAPLIPGFFVSEQSVANTTYNIRGVTSDSTDPRDTPRVAVFQDGIHLANTAGTNVAMFDLDHVDVLKGPQPTAFGRAAQNGAFSTTTNRARNETSSEVTVGFGSFDSRVANGYTNVPVVKDKLFARVAFAYNQADGYVKNQSGNDALQGRDTIAFRSSLRWQPSAETTADLIVNYQRDTPPGIAFRSMSPFLAGDSNYYGDANLNRGDALGAKRDVLGITGIVSHKIDQNLTVVSTTGWRDINSEEEFDADGSPLYLLEAGEYTRAKQFSQDVRFNYDAKERLTASVGAGVFWQEASQTLPFRTDINQLYAILTGGGTLPFPVAPYYEEKFTNYGESLSTDVFGDVTYKLTDRLKVGAGARLTQERQVAGYESYATTTPTLFPIPLLPSAGGGNNFFAPTNGRINATDHVLGWSGAVNATFELTKQHTVYGAISRGRRPPSTTQDVSPFDPTFPTTRLAEESVINYEVGVKGTLANRRLLYSASAFIYDYSHFQTQYAPPPPAPSEPTDGGRARGQGFETTLQGIVNEHLSVFATYGFTDARFAALDENGNPQIYAGNTFRLTSRHTISAGTTLTFPVDDLGTFFVTPYWVWKSEQFFEDNNDQFGGSLSQGDYGLVNIRAGYRARSNRWEVVAFMNNALDKAYLIDAGNIGAQFGFPTSVRGAPRTVGVQTTVRF